MGSSDAPPPHVPSHIVPVCNLFLQIGGCLWTICYFLLVRESFRSQSYGMPLFALALNVSWEAVFAFYIAESALEKFVFTLWLLLDCGMVYSMVKYAKYEWAHSPIIGHNIGSIFAAMTAAALLGHWAFAKWWIDNEVGKREGRYYNGVVGPDATELGFWSAALCQAYLSVACLCQLVVRQHSGGVSWSIWAARTLGSTVGLYGMYAWYWYFWTEAHGYFVSPPAVFLCMLGMVCDCAYAYVLWRVRRTENVLPDGRKVRARDPDLGIVKLA